MENAEKHSRLQALLWIFQGIIVGFGAIMPGISGGTLCVAFGMYQPIIFVLSKPREHLRTYAKMLLLFLLGVLVGFVGLSGAAAWMLEKNSVAVVAAFVGFILGTVPEIWQDAGRKGRGKSDWIAMVLGFVLMLAVLNLLRLQNAASPQASLVSYLFCGILWGLSFIVPGLSSSTLLIFFGLYQPMLDGIAHMRLEVILPLAAGMLACVLLLSGLMNRVFTRWYAKVSHAILGIVLATTVMILPSAEGGFVASWWYLLCIFGGAVVSYGLTRLCGQLKKD